MTSLADEVTTRINKRFDELYRSTETGLFQPYVCLICDELLKPKEVKTINIDILEKNSSLLKPVIWNSMPTDLASCYSYTGHCGNADATVRHEIQQLLLSPRGSYVNTTVHFSEGFTVCSLCKHSLQQCKMPTYAIANNYCFGAVPQCLLDLTEIERAMLTPVKTYGYCFSYTGGIQKQLKGSLSYYKVNFESIAQTVSHFDVLGLTDNIVVVLYGQMTPEQRRKARQKNKVRTRYVLSALEWLVVHNEEWRRRRINLNDIRRRLRNPVLIDNSNNVESNDNGHNNIESTESFQVFFPDGTMCPVTGGQQNLEKFQDLVQAAAQSGYDLDFRANLMTQVATDYQDNNLVNACLLQFPYGRGGLHEQRMKTDGSFTNETDITDYVGHLSRLSQPHFHEELFTLTLYNLVMKQAMVRHAGFRVRNNADARMLAEEITTEDVTEAMSFARLNGGVTTGTRNNDHGRQFLNAVDTIAGAVPHTNESAKRARRDAEAIQHHFGIPTYFLTIVPDDDNSFLVQIYSQVIIDDNQSVNDLSDSELMTRAKQRSQLRIKYPGICAYFFQAVLEIVIEEVIGWDIN
ncbi:MAG: helitron helicase-like domain-containing protein [Comamonadaceae bacterium]|nr:helitron helicase-like domain-containing protein [Comamonadaceae bacterium]